MAIHLSKYLPRLTIRTKLIVAFVGLSIIPVILVGLYGLYSNVKTLQEIALEDLTHDVATVRERSGSLLASVKGDLITLRGSSLMNTLTGELRSGPDGAARTIRELVVPELLAFVKTKGIYYQLSLLDEKRDELARIECSDIADSARNIRVVPPEEYEGSSSDLYFLLAKDLGDDQVVFAPAELRYKGNKQIPVINFVTPLFTGNQRVGLLRASVFAGNLFGVMQTQRALGADEKIVLVGSDGYYLYHSDLAKQWDRLIATRGEENLFSRYPPAVSGAILSDTEGIVSEGIDEIIAHAPLFPRQTESGYSNGVQKDFATGLVVFESIPSRSVMDPARKFGLMFVGFLAIFMVAAVGLGLLATQQFTLPIGEVARGAEIISRGNYSHRLNVKTGDEIEKLAEQFNSMAGALSSHEEEIATHRSRLEELVLRRTKEVVEEKGKLQAILDTVQSAFVLVDGQFRIQTASAAFSAITGFQLAEVQGKDFRIVCSGERGFCKHSGGEIVRGSTKPETHVDHNIDSTTGAERFIEHVTIPILDETGIAFMVVIITDITQRKRLERQLIQSEKLMATGEMAAIIAHEFRNALTSVKMILQLQGESATLSADDRNSFAVALDSIAHMEAIVQQLLNFARPSPLEFRAERIDRLIDECLSFVRLRIHKRRIVVAKEVSSDLPPITIDAQRFREALINILLNAIQAIEGAADNGREQQILVYSKRIILTKNIRDFYTPDMSEYSKKEIQLPEHEILFRKGTECIVIGISDTGPGIGRDILSRIFDPFFTTKSNGTGLGLPMVKRTINAHGGAVIVRTTKGKGTVFEIILPVTHQSEGNAASLQKKTKGTG